MLVMNVKLSQNERQELEYAVALGCVWLTKDDDGVYAHEEEPIKDDTWWFSNSYQILYCGLGEYDWLTKDKCYNILELLD